MASAAYLTELWNYSLAVTVSKRGMNKRSNGPVMTGDRFDTVTRVPALFFSLPSLILHTSEMATYVLFSLRYHASFINVMHQRRHWTHWLGRYGQITNRRVDIQFH